MASVTPYGVQAVQLSATGVFVPHRCLMKKMLVMHSAGADAILKFYDTTTPPGVGDPHYTFDAYGKGVFQVDMPGDGVMFTEGIYVEVPPDADVTVWYERA
jgi:hypothetical protein